MIRIPDDELARLKNDTDLPALVCAAGVELKSEGADLIGLCPFHSEKTASLRVTPGKGLWHCFGCGAGGSVIDWVMKVEGVSFRHAVEILREGAPISGSTAEYCTTVKLECPLDLAASGAELLSQVVEYYHQTLLGSTDGLAYLEDRGIRDDEAIERFKLGLANRSLGLRLPRGNRKHGKRVRAALAALGILKANGREHLHGSLVIPVINDGKVLELYGRKLRKYLREDSKPHLYLPGPHRGVWNIFGLRGAQELILCESLIDALSFWVAGFRNVTSSFGAKGFTPEMHAAIKAHDIRRILIAYDRDDQGNEAASALAKRLGAEGLSCARVLFPKGMDANDYARTTQPAAKSLGFLLANAEHLAGPQPKASVGCAVQRSAPPKPADHLPATQLPEAASSLAAPPSDRADGPQTHNLKPAAEQPPAIARASPPAAVHAKVSDTETTITLGDRRWRIRGLERCMSYEQLKVNLLVARGDHFHVDTFDLYAARHRGGFIRQAADELELKAAIIKTDLGKVLLKLEELQDVQIKRALEPEKPQQVNVDGEDREQALALLRDPRLFERILADFDSCGLVGERTNTLVGYLAAISRKMTKPLGVLVQSLSAAGKTALMKAVLDFVPEEDRVAYSAMTGQSLFYMGEQDLRHKVLAVAEEEGAEKASYPLKLLMSEGELSIASTGKDPASGRLVTQQYRVEGPTAVFLTTTAIDIDEELMNRCLVLTVDEGRAQTQAIHQRQREEETLAGQLRFNDKRHVLKLHQNAQRLLRPLLVHNPFAPKLTFLSSTTRTRRDHMKYLTLIRCVALVRQFQKRVRKIEHRGEEREYVEVELADIELANRLAREILGRTLDELPPQTRRFLELINSHVSKRCEELEIEQQDLRFTRRDIRFVTGWSYDQVRVHLARLVDHEYVLVHHGGRGQSFVYELLWDGAGDDGERFVIGLIDVDKLGGSGSTTGSLGGDRESLAPSLGPHLGGFGPPLGSPPTPSSSTTKKRNGHQSLKNAHLGSEKPPSSQSYDPVVVPSENQQPTTNN